MSTKITRTSGHRFSSDYAKQCEFLAERRAKRNAKNRSRSNNISFIRKRLQKLGDEISKTTNKRSIYIVAEGL